MKFKNTSTMQKWLYFPDKIFNDTKTEESNKNKCNWPEIKKNSDYLFLCHLLKESLLWWKASLMLYILPEFLLFLLTMVQKIHPCCHRFHHPSVVIYNNERLLLSVCKHVTSVFPEWSWIWHSKGFLIINEKEKILSNKTLF